MPNNDPYASYFKPVAISEYEYTVRTDGTGVVVAMQKKPDLNPVVPERVIYNDPATVVIWDDGTKTVAICQEDDVYDRREGFLLCCAKKLMGNGGRYNDVLVKHVPDRHSLSFLANEIGCVK